ncbi:uncharacterized protein LOC114759916 [Neltuma alba]|uniref:uncharacterized protein LOC114759916 n=1 Tax=Neltuma alba TaxID=207710 RepID=UPI0010A2ECDB|nr:uncharacterized protein LOC114759916 [Prosopis alba]
MLLFIRTGRVYPSPDPSREQPWTANVPWAPESNLNFHFAKPVIFHSDTDAKPMLHSLPLLAMDPSNNTETEDETIAFKKKRARRVSFADNEITSVHIFRRDDEDSESPFESTKPCSPADGKSPENEVPGFFRDLAGDSDEEDLKESPAPRNACGNGDDNDDEGEAANVRKSFLKPIGSPSPGSSTAGSIASTDDEDEFHGPVSASFIRPGELSDSAASDGNHDLTMDSTAFSLHYRSLACSDTGDLKTPTRFAAPFEDKTPSATSGRTASGSFMELTKISRLSPHPSVPADTSSVSKDSSDMSIVGENPRRYDYHRLSPSIEAMLAEGSKDLLPAPELDSTGSGLSRPSKASPTWQNNNGGRSPSNPATNDTSGHKEMNISSKSPPINGITNILLFDKGDNTVADASTNQTQSYDCTIKGIKEFVKDAAGPAKKQLDFAVANMKSPPEIDDCLEVSLKHDLGYHYLNENRVKEINLKEAASVSDNDPNQVDGNLIQESTPSPFSGREHLLAVSPDSSGPNGANTPPLKWSSSLLLDKYIRNAETPSSILQNISKLKNLGTSSKTSSVREGIERSKSRLSKYSLGSTPLNMKVNEYEHIRNLNAHLENQLFIVTTTNIGQQSLTNMDAHGAASLMDLGKLSQNEETVDSRMAGEPYHCTTADISHDDKNPKSVEMAACPSNMLHSTAQKINFDLADGTVETIKDENGVLMHKRYSSPLELLHQKSSSLESQKNCFSKLEQLDLHNASCNHSGHSDERSSTATVAKHMEVPISAKSERLAFEVADIVQFPKAMYEKNSAERLDNKAQVLSTYTEGIKQSPIQEASILLSPVEGMPTKSLHHNSDGSYDNYHQMLQTQVADSPSNEFCVENHSGKKRKAIKLLREENIVDKIARIDGTLNVHTNENMDLQIILQQSGDVSDRQKLGSQTCKNYVDILAKFSGSTTQLLGPSADKLNLKMIGMLKDILVHLWRVMKFEILCAEIHSQQKITKPQSIRHRKVMETRTMLYSIAYEKAKLQLMRMKREILQKKIQQLGSGLQECETLKSTYAPFLSKIVASNNTPAKSLFLPISISSEGKRQAMSLELESLVHQAKSLTKFLHNCCKLEDDQKSAGSITLVHDYLKKRMSCKLISRNLQVWEIDNFEHKDACYEILLKYCGCIIQRLIVHTDSPTIIISNKLNDQTILKAFPNMDAFAAFMFVLNPDTTKKCNGSRCLAQETQITSSLLCNLLDLIEEVQLARIEIRNLVQVKFYSQSVGVLELLLYFIDLNTGRKFKVVFDMTCLKCGVYPIEILPSHIYDVTCGEQKPLSRSLEGDIRIAAERVTAGYSRIMRLCRSISQVVQT